MDGIIFFATEQHDQIIEYYTDLGATVWREQPDCTILEIGTCKVGFCARETADTDGILTFVYPDRDGVDRMYERLAETADKPPRYNETYSIYQFFATDPEGRTVEFQTFE